jgi:hypothetical protein
VSERERERESEREREREELARTGVGRSSGAEKGRTRNPIPMGEVLCAMSHAMRGLISCRILCKT